MPGIFYSPQSKMGGLAEGLMQGIQMGTMVRQRNMMEKQQAYEQDYNRFKTSLDAMSNPNLPEQFKVDLYNKEFIPFQQKYMPQHAQHLQPLTEWPNGMEKFTKQVDAVDDMLHSDIKAGMPEVQAREKAHGALSMLYGSADNPRAKAVLDSKIAQQERALNQDYMEKRIKDIKESERQADALTPEIQKALDVPSSITNRKDAALYISQRENQERLKLSKQLETIKEGKADAVTIRESFNSELALFKQRLLLNLKPEEAQSIADADPSVMVEQLMKGKIGASLPPEVKQTLQNQLKDINDTYVPIMRKHLGLRGTQKYEVPTSKQGTNIPDWASGIGLGGK